MFFCINGVRDHKEIASFFVMLNRFFLLCKNCPSVLTISSWMEYKPKLNKKYMPGLHLNSSFESASYKEP